jgi:VanZ family protein
VILEKRKIWAFLYGFGAACVDETIQRFVPDRGPSLKDVGIDTCGVALGIFLLLSVNHLYNQQKTSKENKTL